MREEEESATTAAMPPIESNTMLAMAGTVRECLVCNIVSQGMCCVCLCACCACCAFCGEGGLVLDWWRRRLGLLRVELLCLMREFDDVVSFSVGLLCCLLVGWLVVFVGFGSGHSFRSIK